MTQQPQGAGHPVWRGIGKFFAVVFAVKFILLFPIYLTLVGINSTLLNQSFLESKLTDGVVYDESMAIVKAVLLSEVSGEQNENGDIESGEVVVFDKDILDSIPNLFPEDHFNSIVRDVLEGVFPYIKGETDKLSVALDLSAIQAEFPAHLREVIEKSEPCAPGTDFEAVISSNGLCRPADVNAFFASPEVKGELDSFINEQFPATYVIDSASLENEQRELLENARNVYTKTQTGLFVGGAFFLVLLLLAALLMSQFTHRKIITAGAVLLIPSILLLVGTRLANFLALRGDFELQVEDMTEVAKHGQIIAVHLASGLFQIMTYLSIATTFLGAILMIGGEASKHWLMNRGNKSTK